MFAIIRQANGRRHEVDFGEDPVVVDVAMSDATVQITMTADESGDPERKRFVTVTIPREALVPAMAAAGSAASPAGLWRPKLIT